MEGTLEKIVRQELKIRKDDSIQDNNIKNTWNLEGADNGPQKKPFKNFKNNKHEFKNDGAREVKNNSYENKNNRNNENKGPPGGCFNCEGDHYLKQCVIKPNRSQPQRPPLSQQQAFQQRIHAALDSQQVEQ